MVAMVAETIAKTFFQNTQIAYAVHENKRHLHIHFVFSSVTTDGTKWNLRKKEARILQQRITAYADFLMEQQSLSSTSVPYIAHPISGNQIMKPAKIEDLI